MDNLVVTLTRHPNSTVFVPNDIPDDVLNTLKTFTSLSHCDVQKSPMKFKSKRSLNDRFTELSMRSGKDLIPVDDCHKANLIGQVVHESESVACEMGVVGKSDKQSDILTNVQKCESLSNSNNNSNSNDNKLKSPSEEPISSQEYMKKKEPKLMSDISVLDIVPVISYSNSNNSLKELSDTAKQSGGAGEPGRNLDRQASDIECDDNVISSNSDTKRSSHEQNDKKTLHHSAPALPSSSLTSDSGILVSEVVDEALSSSKVLSLNTEEKCCDKTGGPLSHSTPLRESPSNPHRESPSFNNRDLNLSNCSVKTVDETGSDFETDIYLHWKTTLGTEEEDDESKSMFESGDVDFVVLEECGESCSVDSVESPPVQQQQKRCKVSASPCPENPVEFKEKKQVPASSTSVDVSSSKGSVHNHNQSTSLEQSNKKSRKNWSSSYNSNSSPMDNCSTTSSSLEKPKSRRRQKFSWSSTSESTTSDYSRHIQPDNKALRFVMTTSSGMKAAPLIRKALPKRDDSTAQKKPKQEKNRHSSRQQFSPCSSRSVLIEDVVVECEGEEFPVFVLPRGTDSFDEDDADISSLSDTVSPLHKEQDHSFLSVDEANSLECRDLNQLCELRRHLMAELGLMDV